MSQVRWPDPVPDGATIGVASPSGPVDRAALDRGVAALEAAGYRVRLAPHVADSWHYLAGPEADRVADLHALWSDPEVAACWCARGGYGITRLLDDLDWDLLASRPLPLIGYSDITALQLALLARTGLVSFSGAMVASSYGYGAAAGIDPDTACLLWQWLRPGPRPAVLVNPGDEPLRVVWSGAAEGRLIGGCLTLVATLVGTPYLPDIDGAILVLEDVGEEPYRIDRYLSQLALSGLLGRISGVILGDFEDCFKTPGPSVAELVLTHLRGRDVPVVSGLRYGHVRRRCALPIGAWAKLTTDPPRIAIHAER